MASNCASELLANSAIRYLDSDSDIIIKNISITATISNDDFIPFLTLSGLSAP